MPSSVVRLTVVWLIGAFPLLTFPEIIWPGGRLVAVAACAVSALFAVRILAGHRPFAFLAAILSVLAGLAWAQVSGEKEALTHLSGIAVGILSMAVVAAWCRTPSRLLFVVALFLLAGLAALTLGLAGTTTQPSKLIALDPKSLPELKLGLPGLEANGWVNPNALGGTALMIVPLAAVLAAWQWGRTRFAAPLRLLAGATALVGTAAIIVGQARTVWLAAWLTALVGIAWSVRGRARRWVALLAVGILPFAFLAATRGSDAVRPERIVAEGQFAASFRSQVIWTQAVDQIRSSPWLGIGLNHFRHVYRAPDYLREGTRESAHAHNIVLQTALDLGLPGLLVYVAMMALLLWRAAALVKGPDDVLRRIALGSALGIVGVHLFGMADAVSLGARVGLFQWMSAGFILAASARTTSAHANPIEG